MRESSAEFRELCLEFILTYEGHEKVYLLSLAEESKEACVRYEALRGLQRFGVRFIRVFLLGLTGPNESVRR